MTREECEKQILQKMEEINKIVKDYNPCNTYISLAIYNGTIQFNNDYWIIGNNRINYFGHIKE